jgi:hypothetical protein
MDRHRRIVIKSLIVTCASIVIGKPLVLAKAMGSNDSDDQFWKTYKKKNEISPPATIEKTIDHLYIKDGFVDLVTLSTELIQDGQLKMIGGMENLLFIIDRYNLYGRLN